MKTTGAGPSRIDLWQPSSDDLKHYPHFDAPLKLSEIKKIVNNPTEVARNAFFPLIEYEKKWQPFRTPNAQSSATAQQAKPEAKSRKIRYAARRDAYIYARYRRLLSPLYESALSAHHIEDVPIAYRKIVTTDGKGKCNIDFAKDVFDFISSQDNCYVITLDISKFFESLDHKKIYSDWCNLIGVTDLPVDHNAVFKALTNYRWVELVEAYRRLGYFGEKITKRGQKIEGYLMPLREIPKQLCKPAVFREKIAGNGPNPSIIHKNPNDYGIPQGTPISDLIANIYMIEFDVLLKSLAEAYRGRAFRYSDDILLVVDVADDASALAIEKQVRESISSFGPQLVIKESKSSIHKFFKRESLHSFLHVKGVGKNGLEYLGFRFDGARIYLRDSTLSNLKRKMTFSGRLQASKHKKRYSNRDASKLIESFNFDRFFQSFMRVEDFDRTASVRNWTFWTYARRAVRTFGERGKSIDKQLKFLKPDGKRQIEELLSE